MRAADVKIWKFSQCLDEKEEEEESGVKVIVVDKTQKIQVYIGKMTPKDKILKKCLKQKQICKENQAEEVPWQGKTLHGMHH